MNINEINEKSNLPNEMFEQRVQPKNPKYSDFKKISIEFEAPKEFIKKSPKNQNEIVEQVIEENLKQTVINEIDARLIQNIQNKILPDEQLLNNKQMQDLKLLFGFERLSSLDFLKFDAGKVSKSDLDLFKKLSNGDQLYISNFSNSNIDSQFIIQDTNGQNFSYKSVDFSKGLFNLIDQAYKTQKPVRLDFEGKSSVILKIGTDGKITAQFFSSDAAMEQLLKNNLSSLKNKLDEEGIPYKHIGYKEQKNKQDQNQQNQSKQNDNGG